MNNETISTFHVLSSRRPKETLQSEKNTRRSTEILCYSISITRIRVREESVLLLGLRVTLVESSSAEISSARRTLTTITIECREIRLKNFS